MADTITVLSDIDKIRQRPGMYIGDNDRLGLETIVREIFDNAKDEYPNFPDKDKPVTITLKENDVVSVRDHGRGISPYQSEKRNGEIEERLAYTLMGAGGKFRENREQNGNRFAGGLNGAGACATNAMSEFFHVDIYKDGYHFEDHYEYAVPKTPLKNGNLPKEKLKVPETGTCITFKASKKYMRTTRVDASRICLHAEQAAYLYPGLHVEFINERDGEQLVEFYSERGLLDYMDALAVDENGVPISFLIKPFLISGTAEAEVMGQVNHMEMTLAVAFSREEGSVVKTFTNGVENTSGGTHLSGFYEGLVNLLRHYYEEFLPEYKSKYKTQLELIKKVNGFTSDADVFKLVKTRNIAKKTCVIIDFKHDDPILKPQTKDQLASPEAKPAVANVFYEKASQYLDRNMTAVHELIGYIIKELYEKAKSENTNLNLNKNELKQVTSQKLAAAQSKNPKKKEIFLVEGDSAAGSLKSNRDAEFQAVLPLRGKILNAKRAPLSRLLQNAEIITFINALGTGIGSKYDESKLQYYKIILTTDQDVDGLHIQVLLITLIWEYMPDLIRNGHVYILDTPLYVNVMKGKRPDVYTYSESEQEQFVAKHTKQIEEVQRNKGLGELTDDQVIETILTPESRRLTRLVVEDDEMLYELLEELMGRNVQGRKQLFVKGEWGKDVGERTEIDPNADSNLRDEETAPMFKSNFYDYGMSVIKERALPDVRDGLKPVHRAIAFEMLTSKAMSKDKTKKVKKVTGAVIANWHPHGDSSVEEALVGLAQPWTNTLPVVEIKGNKGSIFGDPAASGRYIETRLTPAGDAFGRKLKPGVVPYVPNFDNTDKMPTILPAQLPYLLINGIKEGIAVGVAASLPPHNAREVLDMVITYMKNPKTRTAELLEHMPGPDFPSGATIINKDDLLEMYKTGVGKILVRATMEYNKKEHALYVREIPYKFAGSMDDLVAELVDATTEKVDAKKKRVPPKITGVNEINNYSGKKGIDICISLAKGVNPDDMIKTLYAKTRLECSVTYLFNALNDKQLGTYSLKRYLAEYVEFQHEIVTNEHQLEQAELNRRMEIIKGRIIASSYIDEIVDVVKHAESRAQVEDVLQHGTILPETKAKYHKVVRTFAFTAIQAEAISGTMLYQLNKLDVDKLMKEGKEIQKRLEVVEKIVSDRKYRHKLIIKRLEEEYKKLPDVPRRTRIIQDEKSVMSKMEVPMVPLFVDIDQYGYVRIEGKSFDGAKETDNKSRIGFFDKSGTCWNLFLDKVKETKNRGTLISQMVDMTEAVVGFSTSIKADGNTGLFIFENGCMKRVEMLKFLTKTRATKISSRTASQPLRAFYDIPEGVNAVEIDGESIFLDDVPLQGLSGSGKSLIKASDVPCNVTFKEVAERPRKTVTKANVFDAVVAFTPDGQLTFDWSTTDVAKVEGLYVTTYQELLKQTLLFVHTDGTAKLVPGSQFAVKTKRTSIVANKDGVTALMITPVTMSTLVGTYTDGKQKRIDVSKIATQGKTGGGVRVFYSTKHTLESVVSGDDSDLPIVSFATLPK